MRGLYCILDIATLSAAHIDPMVFARAVLAVRPAALQVRAKDTSAREQLALLRALGPMCRAAAVPLVANDRADLAALSGADMVHLGQDDVPIELVRRLSPTLKVGLSTHTPEQLACALAQRPDYVAYGPVFTTKSKRNPDAVVGLEGLEAARITVAAHGGGVPLVAIGGIDLERAEGVATHADSAAAIAYLVAGGATDIERRARLLHSGLGGAAFQPSVATSSPALS